MDGLSPRKVEKAREAIDFLSSLSLPEPSRSDTPVSESLPGPSRPRDGNAQSRTVPVTPRLQRQNGELSVCMCCRLVIAFIVLPI